MSWTCTVIKSHASEKSWLWESNYTFMYIHWQLQEGKNLAQKPIIIIILYSPANLISEGKQKTVQVTL